MTTAATLVTVNTGHSANDGTGSTIKDAFDLINTNTNKLNFQLNGDGSHSAQYPGTYLTLANDLYANAGTIQGATIRGQAIYVNGSPVLTSSTGGWNGGTIPYYGIFANTDPSTSTTTGVVTVAGGVGIGGNLNLGGLLNVTGNVTVGNVLATGRLTISNINISGGVTTNTLTVAGATTLSGSTLFTTTSTFNGIPTFNAVSVFNNESSFYSNINLVNSSLVGTSGSIYLNKAVLNIANIGVVNGTSIQSAAIGNVSPGSGSFTILSTSGRATINNNQASTSTTTGALVVTGGTGIGGDLHIGGNLYVEGTTATINTEIINQSIVVATAISAPSIVASTSLSAATLNAVTINAVTMGNIGANHIGTGTYLTSLNGANINSATIPTTALAVKSVTVSPGYGMSGGGTVNLGSSITLTNSGVTQIIAGAGTSVDAATGNVTISVSSLGAFANISHVGTTGVGDIGSSTNTFGTVYATATSAKYADVAENYSSDAYYEPGSVVAFGGTQEVTIAEDGTRKVAGVVSTDPAYLMNSCCEGEFVVAVALQGRVPVKVRGKIEKGDMLVSAGSGFARADYNPILGSVIGKALEDFDGIEGVIEVVVGRL